ncbi:hypothetical protein C8R46DRAFT_1252950 [Mycena filopes]|nr:hypothetical protein C8R46DRAFT_1252950 [Mycena filopes]
MFSAGFFHLPQLSRIYLHFLLPVFYAILDPAEIPTILDRLLSSTSATEFETIRRQTARVLAGLRGLATVGLGRSILPEAFPDLWSRCWAWIDFLHPHEDHLPAADIFSNKATYDVYLSLLRVFNPNYHASGPLIGVSFSLRVVVGRVWRNCLHAEVLEDNAFDGLCGFLAMDFEKVPGGFENFEGLITGAGGRVELASLVILHIQRILPAANTPVAGVTMCRLMGVAYLLESYFSADGDVDFRKVLLSCTLVEVLTTACRALSHSTAEVADILLKCFFNALVIHLNSVRSHTWVAASLRAGLLDVIVTCSLIQRVQDIVVHVLHTILPAHMVYHSVLRQLELSVPEVQDAAASNIIRSSANIIQHWGSFLCLLDERVDIMDEFNTGSLTASRACDNLDATDWQRGGHRSFCGVLSRRRREDDITAKDRSFFRALLNHDYATKLQDIAMNKVQFMHSHPGEIAHMQWDYTSGTLAPSLGSQQDLPHKFREDAVRAMRSGGRIQLHLMAVSDGKEARLRSFPLRSATAGLARGLRRIADSIPPGTRWIDSDEEYVARIQALIDSKLTETH